MSNELVTAILGNDIDKVIEIIENNDGIDINTDLSGFTPFQIAVISNNFNIANYFLENGSDINMRNINNNSMTLLEYCITLNNYEGVEYLINSGANLFLTSPKGETLLDFLEKNQPYNGIIENDNGWVAKNISKIIRRAIYSSMLNSRINLGNEDKLSLARKRLSLAKIGKHYSENDGEIERIISVELEPYSTDRRRQTGRGKLTKKKKRKMRGGFAPEYIYIVHSRHSYEKSDIVFNMTEFLNLIDLSRYILDIVYNKEIKLNNLIEMYEYNNPKLYNIIFNIKDEDGNYIKPFHEKRLLRWLSRTESLPFNFEN